MKYVAIIRKDAESDYGVDFPDLPGCISAGSTIGEVVEMGREALALHLYGVAEDGVVPPPRQLHDIPRDELEGDDVIGYLVLEPNPETTAAAPLATARRLAELVELLPWRREDVAKALDVSTATLGGWLRAGRGEHVDKRQSGFVPPSTEVIYRATVLVRQHAEECAKALRLVA